MLTCLRFRSIRVFFQCSNSADPDDRLQKVCYLHDVFRAKSMQFWQPGQQVLLDETTIRFMGRQRMKVYVKNKPVKWGFKSYTLCDSNTVYNCNFEMYTGGAMDVSQHGLTYNLVMRLMTPYLKQGYKLLTDNYYTSHSLAQALEANDSELVGTVRSNRLGFPDRQKSTKQFEEKGSSGDMHYEHDSNIVYVQWLDKRAVTVLSTMNSAIEYTDKQEKEESTESYMTRHVASRLPSNITTQTWEELIYFINWLVATVFSADQRSSTR